MAIDKSENFYHDYSNQKKIIINLAAGAIAGAFAKTVIAPLDRTKINFQIQDLHFTYKKAYKFLVKSYKNLGLLSLWRGNSATLARVVPYAAIQYSAHEHFKHLLYVETHQQKKDHPGRSFIAGSLAGLVSTTLTYPLDLARARMAVTHKEQYNSLGAVFMKTIREEGFLSLYRGYVPTLLGVIPYAGTGFFTYETLKRLQRDLTDRHEPNPFERLMFGAVAGLLGQSASYPLDIVRRRMQTNNNYKTLIGTIKNIYKNEGLIHGFYKGLSMNWIKGPIAVGISFTTFDLVQKFLIDLPFFKKR